MTQGNLGWSSVLLEGLNHEGEPEPVSGARVPQPEPDPDEDAPVRAPTHGRYKPMPAARDVSDPFEALRGSPSSGFTGSVRLKNQVLVADYSSTPWEADASQRYRDLYRPRVILTPDELDTFVHRDLDAEQPDANPQTQYRQSKLAAKPAPVERPKTSFESVRRRNQRQLDEMFVRHFGETYRD